VTHLWGLLGPKYSARGLEDVLGRYFGGAAFGDALTLVQIPTDVGRWGGC
jgi:hypothetical protein